MQLVEQREFVFELLTGLLLAEGSVGHLLILGELLGVLPLDSSDLLAQAPAIDGPSRSCAGQQQD